MVKAEGLGGWVSSFLGGREVSHEADVTQAAPRTPGAVGGSGEESRCMPTDSSSTHRGWGELSGRSSGPFPPRDELRHGWSWPGACELSAKLAFLLSVLEGSASRPQC